MGAWLARGTHILKDLSSKNRCQFHGRRIRMRPGTDSEWEMVMFGLKLCPTQHWNCSSGKCNDVPLLFAGNLATPHFWATPAATEPQPFPPTKKSQTFPTDPKKKETKKTSSWYVLIIYIIYNISQNIGEKNKHAQNPWSSQKFNSASTKTPWKASVMPPLTAFSTHQWYDLHGELRRRTWHDMGGMRNGDMTWIEHGKWWFIIFHNGEFWEIVMDNS